MAPLPMAQLERSSRGMAVDEVFDAMVGCLAQGAKWLHHGPAHWSWRAVCHA